MSTRSLGKKNFAFSSGIRPLDKAVKGILKGDNVVLKVDDIDDFRPFVDRFVQNALSEHKPLIYFRFAGHEPLIPEDTKNVKMYRLEPEKGFERFISEIITVIEEEGLGGCYVFDLLSDLSAEWVSDVMIGNFFMLACPYLFKFDTVAYFAVLRNRHNQQAINNIQKTAQVVLEIYNMENTMYIQPIKVENRYSPTLYMLHRWKTSKLEGESITPVKESATISRVLAPRKQPWLDFRGKTPDVWHITFRHAQETLEGILAGSIAPVKAEVFKKQLLRMVITRDEKLLLLAEHNFSLEDLLAIGKRIMGTGRIGGKSVGMLLAQAILRKVNPKWENILEIQDSYYIGSEVFYSFLVENNIWWLRRKIGSENFFLEGIEATRNIIFSGTFSSHIMNQFQRMLDYFGQSPIIVRSSSLQEDAYGNSFSGKYESVFLANQGPPKERMAKFLNAVCTVYASTIGRDALTYRKNRGLLDRDEQMALLVQRVSGSSYGKNFYPQAAGVGFSYNPYVWNSKIDPHSGFLRLVFGLGTRAVNRTDDDYARLIALNEPFLRPESNFDDIRQHSQSYVDVLDLSANKLTSHKFRNVIKEASSEDFPIDVYAERDKEMEYRYVQANIKAGFTWVLTFDKLLKKTPFIKDMQLILRTLQDAYEVPVDIEFTVNFFEDEKYKINLLQCRPFHIRREIKEIEAPEEISDPEKIIITKGPIIGTSVATSIDRIVYIVPGVYGKMSMQDRYSIARLVGTINHHATSENKEILLLGPGRWGTSSPSLGIPVTFAEISNISFICEIVEMHEGLVPDISLGSHFFNNLVELEMLYFGLNPEQSESLLNRDFFLTTPNSLGALLPDAEKWGNALKVIDVANNPGELTVKINMNALTQSGIVYQKIQE
ncbi:MAG: PEP/pyruvate-binding domain-containing protein [Promethearchaeota archaeon]